jgi:hypothetical protein
VAEPSRAGGGSAPPRPEDGATTPRPESSGAGPDARATSEVVASTIAHLQAMVVKEIELAKLEVKEVATDKAIAVGTMLAAAVLGLFILAFVGVTAAKALGLVLPEWAAWLIVTVVYALIAGVLVAIGIRRAKRPVMEETKAAFEESKEWAKGQVNR